MEKKWQFAAQHALGSARGIVRLAMSHPIFAAKLLTCRAKYFLRRELTKTLLTPQNFLIATPDALIAYWSMFVERELHASEWVRALLSTKNPLIVDVGANAGVFSHYVHCLKHDSSFIAFEPLPKMVQRLNELKNRTSMNMEIHQKAVSDECGEAWFETAHGYDGTSKLASDKESTGNRIRVDTTTLDAVLASRHILLMKIDVEGFECNVIKGGLKCLSQTDYVIMESESADHLTKVSAALGNNWASRKVGATDYLFFKKAAH